MPGTTVPAGDARHFASELRGLVRAAERRSGRKIDRASLAQVVHVSPQSLYAYLSGSRLPPAAILDALLIELGANNDQLQRLVGIRDQVEESRSAGSRPGMRALRELPPDIACFVDRRSELDYLNAALTARVSWPAMTVVTITGPAGAGKTTLAIHWAYQVADQFPDGLLHVDLRGSDPAGPTIRLGGILCELLKALGVAAKQIPVSEQARRSLYRSVLAGQRILIVLDNAHDAGQADALIPASPASLALITSRDELTALTAVPGAFRIHLDPINRAIEAGRDSGSRPAPTAAGHAQGPRAADGRGTDILPAVAAVPQVRYSLPADAVAFTGRDDELDLITTGLAGAGGAGGVVVVGAIDGMPGVGKTALAVHAAHVLAAEFPDRQLFIDLYAHTPGHDPVTAEDALAGLLAATGVDPRYLPGDLGGRAALWRDKMAGQRAVLVLDNAASSGQVAPLLPGGGRCLVLVTGRRHLGDLPGAVTPVLVDVLPPGEAAEMFTRLAPRAAGDRDGVAEVVALAGFLPLAVSLLARVFARHPSWTLADLAAEVRAGVLTLAAENDSVAATFEVSYRHLDPAAQRLFRLLGVHPGTVTDRYAAAALAATSPERAAGLLDGLHREGLLTEVGHRRYGMHDLLRRYARDHAARDGEGEPAVERLLDYYQHAAARAEARLARQARPGPAPATAAPPPAAPGLHDAGQALAWARAERASLLACLDHVTRASQHGRIVALTAALTELFRRDGPWADAITRHATAIRAARHCADQLGEAGALHSRGDLRQLTDDYPGAARNLDQALGIYRDPRRPARRGQRPAQPRGRAAADR
jgi:transcriptional regulator with XRE-family HTH domain